MGCRSLEFPFNLSRANPGAYAVTGTAGIGESQCVVQDAFSVSRGPIFGVPVDLGFFDVQGILDRLRALGRDVSDFLECQALVIAAIIGATAGEGILDAPDLARLICEGRLTPSVASYRYIEQVEYRWLNNFGYVPSVRRTYRDTFETRPGEGRVQVDRELISETSLR